MTAQLRHVAHVVSREHAACSAQHFSPGFAHVPVAAEPVAEMHSCARAHSNMVSMVDASLAGSRDRHSVAHPATPPVVSVAQFWRHWTAWRHSLRKKHCVLARTAIHF